jgi:hypothetical protein
VRVAGGSSFFDPSGTLATAGLIVVESSFVWAKAAVRHGEFILSILLDFRRRAIAILVLKNLFDVQTE